MYGILLQVFRINVDSLDGVESQLNVLSDDEASLTGKLCFQDNMLTR